MYRALRRCLPCVFVFAAVACADEADEVAVVLSPQTQALLVEAQEAHEALDFRRALQLADSAARRAPASADIAFFRGRLLTDLNRLAAVDSAYREVVRLDPEYPGVWNNLGQNALRQQRYSEAVAHFRKELSVHGPAPIPWHGIGRAYVELGQTDSARVAFEEAAGLDASYVPARLSLALLYQDEGDAERALAYAEEARSAAPQNLEARYLAGSLQHALGRSRAAVPDLEAVAQAWPWHQGAHYNLGQAYVRTGRAEEGRRLLERAEALRAQQAQITNAEQGVRLMPGNPGQHARLASALRLAGRYDDALHAYRVALVLDPGNLEYRANVGVLYLLRGDERAAIVAFQDLLRDHPGFADGWLNLGTLYARVGRMEDAAEAWRRVLVLDPDHRQARANLARLQRGS